MLLVLRETGVRGSVIRMFDIRPNGFHDTRNVGPYSKPPILGAGHVRDGPQREPQSAGSVAQSTSGTRKRANGALVRADDGQVVVTAREHGEQHDFAVPKTNGRALPRPASPWSWPSSLPSAPKRCVAEVIEERLSGV